MSGAGARVGVGTRFRYDVGIVEVVEMAATTAGNEVVLKDGGGRLLRLALKELMFSDRAVLIPEQPGPSADDGEEIASVILQFLADHQAPQPGAGVVGRDGVSHRLEAYGAVRALCPHFTALTATRWSSSKRAVSGQHLLRKKAVRLLWPHRPLFAVSFTFRRSNTSHARPVARVGLSAVHGAFPVRRTRGASMACRGGCGSPEIGPKLGSFNSANPQAAV